jgi:hypothetical protein
MTTYVHSHIWLICLLYQTSDKYGYVHAYTHTHTHTHARKHRTTWYQAPMKHTWKRMCTYTSTLPNKQYLWICTCIHTHTHTHARTQASNHLEWSTYETHMKTYVHSHFWLILPLYHTSDTYRYVPVYTLHTRTQASNYLVSSTCETHMKTYASAHFWLILLLDSSFCSTTQVIHIDM